MMDWLCPWVLIAIPVAGVLLWWFPLRTRTTMSRSRQVGLFAVRWSTVSLVVAAVAAPAVPWPSQARAVVFVLDHSQSQSLEGLTAALERVQQLADSTSFRTQTAIVSTGESAHILQPLEPSKSFSDTDRLRELVERNGAHSNLEAGLMLAVRLLPAEANRRIVYLGDGLETRGTARQAAEEAAVAGVAIDIVPVRGPYQRDARILALRPNRTRIDEGATLELAAQLESAFSTTIQLELVENGIVVERRSVALDAGMRQTVRFQRTPSQPRLYRYSVRLTELSDDGNPDNNQAQALVDVRGRPALLFVEGEPDASAALPEALEAEGLLLESRAPDAFPETLAELTGYDGVVLSDVPADRFSRSQLRVLREYVESLGGGLVVVGGIQTATAAAFRGSPLEDLLPLHIPEPEREERQSVALALVIDKSGSMNGEKLQLSKSAAVGTADLLTAMDQLCVVAFDGAATTVVPMAPVTSRSALRAGLTSLSAGGGTNISAGMRQGWEALAQTQARIKHMIVLSDGQTEGTGYDALARSIREQRITISTVAVGSDAAHELLRSIAEVAGGRYYETVDPSAIPRIFTQDTRQHTQPTIREMPFTPRPHHPHPLVRGWVTEWSQDALPLLGYVQTRAKQTAITPLVTDRGDPLLTVWQYGLGQVAAFTSDCKPRWSALWLSQWPEGYSQFWTQLLRATKRETQNGMMEMQLTDAGQQLRIGVDLLENADTFDNGQQVAAEILLLDDTDASPLPPAAGESNADAGKTGKTGTDPVAQLKLPQVGPGRYEATARLDQDGTYLVRCQSGSRMVTGAIVRNRSTEAATGQIDRELLQKLADTTGGRVLEPGDRLLETSPPPIPGFVGKGRARQMFELRPWLLVAALLTFLIDVLIRRWPSVLALADAVGVKSSKSGRLLCLGLSVVSQAASPASLTAQTPESLTRRTSLALPAGFLTKATATACDGTVYCVGTSPAGDRLLILQSEERSTESSDELSTRVRSVVFAREQAVLSVLACDEQAVYLVVRTQSSRRHSECRLMAISREGAIRWKSPPFIDAEPVQLAIGPNRRLLLGTADGALHALSHSGELKWTFAQPAAVVADLACNLDGTTCMVLRSPGPARRTRVLAVNAAGRLIWRREFDDADESANATRRQIALDHDGALVIAWPGRVAKLNHPGDVQWTARLPENLQVVGGPFLDEAGRILLTASSGHVFQNGRAPHFALQLDEAGRIRFQVLLAHSPIDARLTTEGLQIVGFDAEHRLQETLVRDDGAIRATTQIAAADSPFAHFYNWRLAPFLMTVSNAASANPGHRQFRIRAPQDGTRLALRAAAWPTDDGPSMGRSSLLGDGQSTAVLKQIYAAELAAVHNHSTAELIEQVETCLTMDERVQAHYDSVLAELDAESFPARLAARRALEHACSQFPAAFPVYLESRRSSAPTPEQRFQLTKLLEHHTLPWQQDPQLRQLMAAVLRLCEADTAQTRAVLQRIADHCPNLFLGRICSRN